MKILPEMTCVFGQGRTEEIVEFIRRRNPQTPDYDGNRLGGGLHAENALSLDTV